MLLDTATSFTEKRNDELIQWANSIQKRIVLTHHVCFVACSTTIAWQLGGDEEDDERELAERKRGSDGRN